MENEIYTYRSADCLTYYKNGKQHREDGPAIEYDNGDYEWYINGLLHREDGPAIRFHDDKTNKTRLSWYIDNELHREDGPAYIDEDGKFHWFLRGEKLTEEEFNVWLAKKNFHDKLQKKFTEKPKQKQPKI